MDRDVCLIVNPSAGGGRAARRLPDVEAALRAHGIRFRVERTTSIEHARDLAGETVANGEAAVTLGGDGLAGAVAGELRGTDGLLGVLPGGRGNDFVRKLGISQDPVAACAVLAAGHVRAIDLAVVGGRSYLGIASAGFDSVCQDICLRTRLKLGSLVYVYGTLRAIRTWRPATWEVTVDDTTHTFTGWSVSVANSGRFGGGMQLVPGASLDDGMLDVVLTADSTRWHFLSGLPKVFKGTHLDDPALTFLKGKRITFAADRQFSVYADGDPIAPALPVTVTIAPRSLRVVAPA